MSAKAIAAWAAVAGGLACLFLFWLVYGNHSVPGDGRWGFLTHVNALMNTLCSVCLVFGFLEIKRGRITRHKRWMTAALCASAVFLISYVSYHYLHGDTSFTRGGWVRGVYLFILVSHIVLSVVALPLVLATYALGLLNKVVIHKKFAKITLPLWFYVSVSGVAVYLFLRWDQWL